MFVRSYLHLKVASADLIHFLSLDRVVNGTGKDIGNPSWRRSLPHVLVAALSSFLFGYHLGYVPLF